MENGSDGAPPPPSFRLESTVVDRELEAKYVPFLEQTMGMPREIATQFFEHFLKEAKEGAVTDGTEGFPEKFGDVLLEKERNDPMVKDTFADKRREGVADQDIQLWWNLHEYERRIIVQIDEMGRNIVFKQLQRNDGLDDKAAAFQVARQFPIYGDPEHRPFGTMEDRPLPYELKYRINYYIQRRHQQDLKKFDEDVARAGTINALIRQALRDGEL